MAGNFLLIVCVQSWCIITTRQLIFLRFFIFMIECANPPSLTLQLLIKCKTFVRCNINDRDAQNYLLGARFCLDDWCPCTSIYCFPIFIHFSVKKINDNNNNVYKKNNFYMWLNRFCLSPIYIYECYQKNENQKLRDGEEILLSRWIYGYFQNPTLESIFKNLCCPLILKMVVKSWTENC